MDNFKKDIDERTNLTSSNRFELLLFRLGSSPDEDQSELYGINVFKLREIVPMPTLTKAAGMASPMMGIANIRGEIIPVIDLPAVVGCVPKTGLNILLLTEYARSTQAFAVESVDDIVRLEWARSWPLNPALRAAISPVSPALTTIKPVTGWRWSWTSSKSCTTSFRLIVMSKSTVRKLKPLIS